jgi:hypothetical protein
MANAMRAMLVILIVCVALIFAVGLPSRRIDHRQVRPRGLFTRTFPLDFPAAAVADLKCYSLAAPTADSLTLETFALDGAARPAKAYQLTPTQPLDVQLAASDFDAPHILQISSAQSPRRFACHLFARTRVALPSSDSDAAREYVLAFSSAPLKGAAEVAFLKEIPIDGDSALLIYNNSSTSARFDLFQSKASSVPIASLEIEANGKALAALGKQREAKTLFLMPAARVEYFAFMLAESRGAPVSLPLVSAAPVRRDPAELYALPFDNTASANELFLRSKTRGHVHLTFRDELGEVLAQEEQRLEADQTATLVLADSSLINRKGYAVVKPAFKAGLADLRVANGRYFSAGSRSESAAEAPVPYALIFAQPVVLKADFSQKSAAAAAAVGSPGASCEFDSQCNAPGQSDNKCCKGKDVSHCAPRSSTCCTVQGDYFDSMGMPILITSGYGVPAGKICCPYGGCNTGERCCYKSKAGSGSVTVTESHCATKEGICCAGAPGGACDSGQKCCASSSGNGYCIDEDGVCCENAPGGKCASAEECCDDRKTCVTNRIECCSASPGGKCAEGESCCSDDKTCVSADESYRCCINLPGGLCPSGETCCLDFLDRNCVELGQEKRCCSRAPGGKCMPGEVCCGDAKTCVIDPESCCENAPGGACPLGQGCCDDNYTCVEKDKVSTCCGGAPGNVCPEKTKCCYDPRVPGVGGCAKTEPVGSFPSEECCVTNYHSKCEYDEDCCEKEYVDPVTSQVTPLRVCKYRVDVCCTDSPPAEMPYRCPKDNTCCYGCANTSPANCCSKDTVADTARKICCPTGRISCTEAGASVCCDAGEVCEASGCLSATPSGTPSASPTFEPPSPSPTSSAAASSSSTATASVTPVVTPSGASTAISSAAPSATFTASATPVVTLSPNPPPTSPSPTLTLSPTPSRAVSAAYSPIPTATQRISPSATPAWTSMPTTAVTYQATPLSALSKIPGSTRPSQRSRASGGRSNARRQSTRTN